VDACALDVEEAVLDVEQLAWDCERYGRHALPLD
jgi:hypothetical protein